MAKYYTEVRVPLLRTKDLRAGVWARITHGIYVGPYVEMTVNSWKTLEAVSGFDVFIISHRQNRISLSLVQQGVWLDMLFYLVYVSSPVNWTEIKLL